MAVDTTAAGGRGPYEARLVGWQGYAFAAGTIILLALMDLALRPVFPGAYFRLPFILIIGLTGYLYGRGPAITAFLLSIIGYSLVYAPVAVDQADWAQLIVFVASGLIAGLALARLRDYRISSRKQAESMRREIAERTRAENELRSNQRLLQDIMENSPTQIFVKDLQGRVIMANTAFRAFRGPKEEILGKTVHELWPEDTARTLEAEDRKVMAEGTSGQFEETVHLPDEVRTYLASKFPLRNIQGEMYGLGAIYTDITDRKQIEEALKEREYEYRTLTENIPEVIARFDRQLRHTFINEYGMRVYGMPREQVIGKTNADLGMPPDKVAFWKQHFEEVLTSGQQQTVEFEFDSPTFGHQYFSALFVPEFDDKQEVISILSITRDITSLRRADEQIRKLNEELEQRVIQRTAELEAANRELEAFSYSVSHDLRAPLRAIDGFSSALLKHNLEELDARGKDYLQRVRAAAQKMGHLIDDLLGLSRATRAEVKRQNLELSAMVREITEELQHSQPERKARFDIQPNLWDSADPHLIRIALDNLLGNAWKFTGEREEAIIKFGATGADGERVYHITDNGAGFDPTYAGKLFSPFQRLHTESEFPGTGIGLALVQRIIRKHGGRIWAEGTVGKGATFYFTLTQAKP